VNKIGLEELKPKGEIETSTFIREVLRRLFFAVFNKHKKILWEAVTSAEWPPFTYWPRAKKIFEEAIGGDDLPPAKARGSLKAEWENHFDIEIGQLERQESQQRTSDGKAQAAPKSAKATADAPKGFELGPPDPIEDYRGAASKKPNAKRGPRPNTDRHQRIAAVVKSYRTDWKESSNLEQIATELDTGKIATPPGWARRERHAKSWTRATEYYPDLVRKALAYSLKMDAKDTSGKPSQTLANPR
jgi:hypothetical protein